MRLSMNRKYAILLFLCSIAFGSINSEKNDNKYSEILNSILAQYNKSISFTLDASHSKMKLLMHVKMMYSKEDSITRKIFAEFVEPKEVEGMNAWIWDYSDGVSKVWVTKPSSGKLIDVSNKKDKLPIDISLIQLDESILGQFNTVSDTVEYAGVEAYVIDFYKIKKSKKMSPIMKIWISSSESQILKIEKLSKKGKVISETIFKEYFKGFPKLIAINEFKDKNELIINISDYNESNFEDIGIFQPIDKKND